MTAPTPSPASRRNLWIWLLSAVLTLALVGGGAAFVAWLQNRSAVEETRTAVLEVPAAARTQAGPTNPAPSAELDPEAAPASDAADAADARGEEPARDQDASATAAPLTIRLDLSVAQGIVRATAAGTGLQLEASFDTSSYELVHEEISTGTTTDGAVRHIALRPIGSETWALLRAKVGGPVPRLFLGIPEDLDVELIVENVRGFVALELADLRVHACRLVSRDGGAKVSISRPTAVPMEILSARGNMGYLDISGLGNGNPRSTFISQGVGIVDLDLRGEWIRDGYVEVEGGLSGGTLWLPSHVRIEEAGEGVTLQDPPAEVPAAPTLTLDAPLDRTQVLVIR